MLQTDYVALKPGYRNENWNFHKKKLERAVVLFTLGLAALENHKCYITVR